MRLINPDSTKSLEQRVTEAFLKKLYIKVDDDAIFINKEDFISLILRDIIAIAKADFDLDKALKIALKVQKEYQSIPDTKRNELEEAARDFDIEIQAYQYYLISVKEKMDEDEIYNQVFSILNSEIELLEKKLYALIMDSLGNKLSEQDAAAMGLDRWSLLFTFAAYVKFIASNETIDDAVEEMQLDMEINPENYLVKKESVKKELLRISPLAKNEISAYKVALSMYNQDAEIPMVLAMVKQLLHLEE